MEKWHQDKKYLGENQKSRRQAEWHDSEPVNFAIANQYIILEY